MKLKSGTVIKSPRTGCRTNMLFKDMYVSLMADKIVYYMTHQNIPDIECRFKYLFDVNVKCDRIKQNIVKLNLVKNE